MLQASEGGRVYLGRSALETSLREAPALGQSGLIPVPMASVPTERISRAAPELPTEPDVIEKGVLVAKSTLAGLCLTAFACGIITTIAIGHGHAPSSVAQVARVQSSRWQRPRRPTPAPAEVPAAAPAPADPVVVQMAGTPAAETERAVDKAPAAHVVAARTPRPPVTRTAPARRRPTTDAPATVADAPACQRACRGEVGRSVR